MRVYLAGAYESRDELRPLADQLVRLGHECTSTWLLEKYEIGPGTAGPAADLETDTVARHCLSDLYDVARSDALVLFTESATGFRGGGGRHVETGYALANRIPVTVVGDPEHIFHRGSCQIVGDWSSALEALALVDLETELISE